MHSVISSHSSQLFLPAVFFKYISIVRSAALHARKTSFVTMMKAQWKPRPGYLDIKPTVLTICDFPHYRRRKKCQKGLGRKISPPFVPAFRLLCVIFVKHPSENLNIANPSENHLYKVYPSEITPKRGRPLWKTRP